MFCRKAFRKSGRYCIKKDSAEEIFLDKWISHTAVMWASSVCVLHVGFTFHFYVVLHKMHGFPFATFHHDKKNTKYVNVNEVLFSGVSRNVLSFQLQFG